MIFKSFDIVPHGTKFDFVGKRHVAVVLSVIVNLAVLGWSFKGLNFGVDFAGGTEMEVKFASPVDPGAIRKGVEELGFKDASVQTYGPESEHTFLIRVGRVALMSAEDFQKVVGAVRAQFAVKGEPSFNPDVGDRVDFQFEGHVDPGALRAAVEGAGVPVHSVQEEQGLTPGSRIYAVKTAGIREKVEQDLGARFGQAKPEVRRVEFVGPAVGRELRNQGFKAVLYAMALIVIYVGLRFDFRFSPGVIIAIVHDAIVTLGYFAFSGREFNLTSIAVILTVVGYSVNDTVVVYDRIRENVQKLKGRALGEVVNHSINEVLGRTFLTSVATALSLVGLLVFGVGTIFDFAFAMLIGIVSGTYSTWFIAAPMTVWLEERAARRSGARVSA